MRDIRVRSTNNPAASPLRCFVYGKTGMWKTSFAGTFPRPVFLSVGVEGGDRTLSAYPDVDIIDIASEFDRRPGVATMEAALGFVEREHKKRGWRTLVLDSVSYYASEVALADIVRKRAGASSDALVERTADQHDYGTLDMHMNKWLMTRLHRLPLHVVWIALEQVKQDDKGAVIDVRPMLSGQTAVKLPAACDLILYADTTRLKDPQTGKPTSTHVMRTIPHGHATARGRFWNVFPNGWIHPHFQCLADEIGPWIGEAPSTDAPSRVAASGGNGTTLPAEASLDDEAVPQDIQV